MKTGELGTESSVCVPAPDKWIAGTYYRITHRRIRVYLLDIYADDKRAMWTENVENAATYNTAEQAREARDSLNLVDREPARVVRVTVLRSGKYMESPTVRRWREERERRG